MADEKSHKLAEAVKIYRVRREKLYSLSKHLFSGSVKFFSTHPVD